MEHINESPFRDQNHPLNLKSVLEIKKLLQEGADPNAHPNLLRALQEGSKQKLDLLLKNGADAKALWHKSSPLMVDSTLLHFCAASSNVNGNVPKFAAMAKELIKHGADVNAVNDYGKTALCVASRPEMVEALLECGASTLIDDHYELRAQKGPTGRRLIEEAHRVQLIERDRKELMASLDKPFQAKEQQQEERQTRQRKM